MGRIPYLFLLVCLLCPFVTNAKTTPTRGPAGAKDGGGGAGLMCEVTPEKKSLSDRLGLSKWVTFRMLEVAEGLKEGDVFQPLKLTSLDEDEYAAKSYIAYLRPSYKDDYPNLTKEEWHRRQQLFSAMNFATEVVANSIFHAQKIDNRDPDYGFSKWGEEFKKEKCSIRWIAYYIDSQRMLYVAYPIYWRLTLLDQAALYLHESIYRAARLVRNEQNSQEVRRLVRGILRGDKSIIPDLENIFVVEGRGLTEWSDYGMGVPAVRGSTSFKIGPEGQQPVVIPPR